MSGALTRRTFLGGVAAAAGAAALSGCGTPAPRAAPAPIAARRTVAGYVPYWDQPAAFAVAMAQRNRFDQISPMWFAPDTDGTIVPADDENTLLDPAAVAALRAARIDVLPTITNLRNGDWDPALVSGLLTDPAVRAQHISEIVDLARGYDGIDIDYESLGEADRGNYSAFLTDLGANLHARGKLLVSSVYTKTSEPGPDPQNQAQDYAAIAAACDQVRLMAYDFHYEESEPGPGAPVAWVRENLEFAVRAMPREKLALGVVLLGYDWTVNEDGASGETISWAQATALAREKNSTILRDGDRTPYFRYTGDDDLRHEVWFEDAESSAPRIALVEEFDLGAVFFWRLGGEDPRTWDLVAAKS